MRQFKLVLFAAAVALSGPVAAQPQQTPETAQQFLGITSQNIRFEIEMINGRLVYDKSVVLWMAKKDDNCITSAEVVLDYQYENLGGTRYTPIKERKLYYINWKDVAEVKQETNRVHVTFKGTSNSNGYHCCRKFRFQYPTEALATRTTFAMEFLRQECDPTAGLAF